MTDSLGQPVHQVHYNYAYISGDVTKIVDDAPGMLHCVTVNQAATTVTLYDGTSGSGTKFATIGTGTGSFIFDVGYSALYVAVAGSGADVTISFRNYQ